MKEKINKDIWNRNKQFKFFSKFDSPYTGCTTLIDVNNLVKFSKENKISFYGLMTYFTIRALNEIDEFKYVLEENEIYKYGKINTSFSVLKDNNQINFSRTIEYSNFKKFINDFNDAKLEAESDKTIPYIKDYNKCYITCIPWMRVTSVLNPMNYEVKDSIPRVCWGKYFLQDGKYMIDYSIQVNHAFQDGYHIGLLINHIQNDIYSFYGGQNDFMC